MFPNLWYFEDYLKDIKHGTPETKRNELADLIEVGKMVYIYINQIFGDEYLRNQVIKNIGILWEGEEIKPPEDIEIADAEVEGDQFDGGHHLYIKSSANPDQRMCSVDDRYQITTINRNDTLCQSYSLLTAYGLLHDRHKPYPKTRKNQKTQKQEDIDYSKQQSQSIARMKSHIMIQKDMIKMYRKIVNHPKFMKILGDTIEKRRKNGVRWIKEINSKGHILYEDWEFNRGLAHKIISIEMENTLNSWDEHGYMWFVGNPEKDLATTGSFSSPDLSEEETESSATQVTDLPVQQPMIVQPHRPSFIEPYPYPYPYTYGPSRLPLPATPLVYTPAPDLVMQPTNNNRPPSPRVRRSKRLYGSGKKVGSNTKKSMSLRKKAYSRSGKFSRKVKTSN